MDLGKTASCLVEWGGFAAGGVAAIKFFRDYRAITKPGPGVRTTFQWSPETLAAMEEAEEARARTNRILKKMGGKPIGQPDNH